MNKFFLIILLLGFIVFESCQDRKNIVVIGQIVDEATGLPIPKAEVVVLCWYMSNIDDATFKKKTLITDGNGNYKTTFNEGYEIDIASKSVGYIANRSYNKLKDNKISVTLKLAKAKANPTLITVLNTDNAMFNGTNKIPFLRIRIHEGKNHSLDYTNIETFGFDFSTLTTNNDTSKCDLWFKIEKKEEQPTIINTNKNGGIIPIYNDEVKSSLLYEKSTAPTTGYKNEIELKGNEEGFFVLCRDGKRYGKIILEHSSIDISSPDGHGSFYKEFGKNFSCLYQPNETTNLSYSIPNLNLENFLVDYRL
ncbi:MAG: hypothetical protein RJA07_1035 [Bacteroidota bacterium]|jgi:hypothetical protein